MSLLVALSLALFSLSLLGILTVFVLYPLAVLAVSLVKGKKRVVQDSLRPPVSLLVVARNAQDLIEAKIRNSLSLDYPKELLELVLVSDGSTDDTEKIARTYEGQGVRVFAAPGHHGKIEAINRFFANCSGDIVVLSDADAILPPDAVWKMTRHYADPAVGGVCGRRTIGEGGVDLRGAQRSYIGFDSLIKTLETRIGSISSNDGKLYSIRKELFQPIAAAVTDDLYVCLSIVRQQRRFVFEPEAKAYIRVPSRSPSHEVARRRRIVSTSLRGICLMREVLNPLRHGFFSIGVLVNKLLKRLLSVCLIVLFLTSLSLAFDSTAIAVFLALQALFCLLALSYPLLRRLPGMKALRKTASLAYYFCVGNWGSLLGVVDFLTGRQIVKWEPVKTD